MPLFRLYRAPIFTEKERHLLLVGNGLGNALETGSLVGGGLSLLLRLGDIILDLQSTVALEVKGRAGSAPSVGDAVHLVEVRVVHGVVLGSLGVVLLLQIKLSSRSRVGVVGKWRRRKREKYRTDNQDVPHLIAFGHGNKTSFKEKETYVILLHGVVHEATHERP